MYKILSSSIINDDENEGGTTTSLPLHIMTLFYHFELHNYFHSSSTSYSLSLIRCSFRKNACSLFFILFFAFF